MQHLSWVHWEKQDATALRTVPGVKSIRSVWKSDIPKWVLIYRYPSNRTSDRPVFQIWICCYWTLPTSFAEQKIICWTKNRMVWSPSKYYWCQFLEQWCRAERITLYVFGCSGLISDDSTFLICASNQYDLIAFRSHLGLAAGLWWWSRLSVVQVDGWIGSTVMVVASSWSIMGWLVVTISVWCMGLPFLHPKSVTGSRSRPHCKGFFDSWCTSRPETCIDVISVTSLNKSDQDFSSWDSG